jgi:hypothetical protein
MPVDDKHDAECDTNKGNDKCDDEGKFFFSLSISFKLMNIM